VVKQIVNQVISVLPSSGERIKWAACGPRSDRPYGNGFFFHYHISASKQYQTTELFTAANGY